MKYRPINVTPQEADFIVEVFTKVLEKESFVIKTYYSARVGAVFIKNLIRKAEKAKGKLSSTNSEGGEE
jgi:hypothetical protein